MRQISRVMTTIILFVAFLAIGAPVWAEDENFPERFMIRFGGYQVQNASTIARLDSNNLPIGTYVDFENTLGGESRASVLRLDGLYRFNNKHSIGFSWYAMKFTGSRTLSQDIVWNGVTYPIDTHVDSNLRYNVYKLNYQYSLAHTDEVELGVSAGLHIIHASFNITAETINTAEGDSVTAPLPDIGLFGNYKFTPRFSGFFYYQVFAVDYQNKIKGGMQDFLLGLEYRLIRHFAVGAAYNRFNLSADVTGNNQTLHFDTNWNGLMLYGSLYF
jgi:hypothetical protein